MEKWRFFEPVFGIEVAHYATSHGQRLYDRKKFLQKLDHFEQCFQKRDEQIIEAVRKRPQNADELALEGIIYRKGLLKDPLKVYFALKMIQKHCERLVGLGELTFDGERYHLP